MKLVIAIIDAKFARRLREALAAAGYGFTELGGTGGFLREGNVTLLIGVKAEEVDTVLDLLDRHCQHREQSVTLPSVDTRLYSNPAGEVETISVGGAHVFVVAVERVVHI